MKRNVLTGISLATLILTTASIVWFVYPSTVQAHCQVPCGIYDDGARITRLHEDATTIAKAIKQINELSGSHGAQTINQVARWINTKEDHASHVIEVVSEYFLTQKVKPVAAGADGREAYLNKLADHHAVMVAAMKTKQKVDASTADTLHHAIDALAAHYK